MKYSSKLLVLFILLIILGGCAGNMYQTRDSHKLKHRYYGAEKPVTEPEPQQGETVWMVCSFYADKFHGKQTSNGEIFDMYKLTCAHKELPFNTVLRVTDLDSGKTVQVRVNDRGPFIEGRDLDLSYGAAQKVGLVPYGVKKLQVKILEKP